MYSILCITNLEVNSVPYIDDTVIMFYQFLLKEVRLILLNG